VIGTAISRNALILGLFAIGAAAALTLTQQATETRVFCNRQQALADTLAQVMPPARHDNRLREDRITVTDERLGPGPKALYRARRHGQPAGVVLQATAPDGYGGAIDLLVGLDRAGTVLGVRVIPPHHETPGLGDGIERRKSAWIVAFNGTSLARPGTGGWAVKQEGGVFDAFSGATITPRAVIGAVHRALLYFQAHRDSLFQRPSTSAAAGPRCHGE
jgi:electron transport complex protein RnfG